MKTFDVLVVGGGIAGVSVAYELSTSLRVGLLEMESTLAFHTTGRSAATWIGTYGNVPVRALTAASHDFLLHPPEGFAEHALVRPLGVLHVAGPGQAGLVEALHADVSAMTPQARLVDGEEAQRLLPLLRADRVEAALVEPGALEVDVHGLHQSYRRGLLRNDGEIAVAAEVVGAERAADRWVVTTAAGAQYAATYVVDAAGAWADRVGALFGATPIGIEPLRRTVFMVAAPPLPPDLPMAIAVDESFYVKVDGAQLLCSPSDATPVEPGDARPDELEIARAIEAINEATTLGIRSVRSAWAGLRSFVPDRTHVIGRDPGVEGLFWFAGQGGYGIQSAPATARLAAALLREEPVPADLAATGLDVASVSPGRLAASR